MMLHRFLFTTSFLVGLTFPFQVQASDRVAWPKDICEHVCHEETCISSDHIYNLCKTHCIGHFTTKCAAAKRTKITKQDEMTPEKRAQIKKWHDQTLAEAAKDEEEHLKSKLQPQDEMIQEKQKLEPETTISESKVGDESSLGGELKEPETFLDTPSLETTLGKEESLGELKDMEIPSAPSLEEIQEKSLESPQGMEHPSAPSLGEMSEEMPLKKHESMEIPSAPSLEEIQEKPLEEPKGMEPPSAPSLDEMSEEMPLKETEGMEGHSEEGLLTPKKEIFSMPTSTETPQIDLETKHQINEIYQKTIEIHALVVSLAQQYIKEKKSEEKVAVEHKIDPSVPSTTSKKHHHHSKTSDIFEELGKGAVKGVVEFMGR